MPSSRHSDNRDDRRHERDHHRRCDDYYSYEYEYGPNPLALYYLNRPIYGLGYGGLGYGGLGYGGLGYGGLGYGRGRFW